MSERNPAGLTERQLNRVRNTAYGTDIAFLATYTRGGSFTAEAFHNELDVVEAYAMAAFLRSYARELEQNAESMAVLGEVDNGQ